MICGSGRGYGVVCRVLVEVGSGGWEAGGDGCTLGRSDHVGSRSAACSGRSMPPLGAWRSLPELQASRTSETNDAVNLNVNFGKPNDKLCNFRKAPLVTSQWQQNANDCK